MKKLLFLLLFIVFSAHKTSAQIIPYDSTTVTFAPTDSLHRTLPGWLNESSHTGGPVKFAIDTTGCHLWQVGYTKKSIFSNTADSAYGIMTGTLHPYPANANDHFAFNFNGTATNPTIELWHEYNIRSGHATGYIEFSTDTGATWVNISDCWNVNVINLYTNADTLYASKAGLSGQKTMQHSTIYFLNCLAEKNTSTDCMFLNEGADLWLRFNFISDTLTDSLSGWKIDSIRLVSSTCGSGVQEVTNKTSLKVSPNPSANGAFYFPALKDATGINIYDGRGARVMSMPYKTYIDLSAYPQGIYFYKVSSGTNVYSGKLLYE